ncbi:MAG: hypothetical protein WAR79_09660 [Melioribacteraceae bacterium]
MKINFFIRLSLIIFLLTNNTQIICQKDSSEFKTEVIDSSIILTKNEITELNKNEIHEKLIPEFKNREKVTLLKKSDGKNYQDSSYDNNNDKLENSSVQFTNLSNSVYLSFCTGLPGNKKYEFGYNFNSFSIGLTICKFKFLPENQNEYFPGIISKFNFPINNDFTTFLSIGFGSDFKILLSEPTNYVSFNFGTKINILKWFHINPEISFTTFSDMTEEGFTFSEDGIELTSIKGQTRFLFNIAFEIEFASLF